jgi:hypothetical protein
MLQKLLWQAALDAGIVDVLAPTASVAREEAP